MGLLEFSILGVLGHWIIARFFCFGIAACQHSTKKQQGKREEEFVPHDVQIFVFPPTGVDMLECYFSPVTMYW